MVCFQVIANNNILCSLYQMKNDTIQKFLEPELWNKLVFFKCLMIIYYTLYFFYTNLLTLIYSYIPCTCNNKCNVHYI